MCLSASLVVVVVAVVVATAFTTVVRSDLHPPRDTSETRRITNLQLLHPMPLLPPLDRGHPDEPFSNIPSEAFTLDTKTDSKRTFKKDLSKVLSSNGVYPSSEVAVDDDAYILLVKQGDSDLAASFDKLLKHARDEAEDKGAGAGAGSRSEDSSGDILWNYVQNPHSNSIYSNLNRKSKLIDTQINDLFTKELGTIHEPMTPFVDRESIDRQTQSYSNNERYDTHYNYDINQKHYDTNKEHYGSSKECYDSNKQHYYGSNKVLYDLKNKQNDNGLKMSNYHSDKVYFGPHKHYGSDNEHYGPHKHYESGKGEYGSREDHYGYGSHPARVKLSISEERVEDRVNSAMSPEIAEAFCSRLYSEPMKAALCAGRMSRGACDRRDPPARREGANKEGWLVLGEGNDQSGQSPLVV